MTILLKSPEAEAYQPLEIPAESLNLTDSPSGTLPPIPEGGEPYYRMYANSEQNGRVDVAVPCGKWALEWESALRPGFIPEAVLSSGERILVQTGVWQLFSPEGELVREGSVGSGGITLDAEKGLFYHMNKLGDLAGRQLSDGDQAFALMPFLGEEFSRTLIRRVDDRLLLVGIERQLDPHGHKKAKRTLLEWIHLGDELKLTASGMLASAANAGTLILPSTRTVTAASDAMVVVAAPDSLYFSTPDATITHAFAGDIKPVALSLGGNGVTYLVAREGDRLALWCLAGDGTLLRRYTCPEGIQGVVAPPVVGFDGRVYLVTQGAILALGPDLNLVWESSERTPYVGATVTRNGTLVVSSSRAVGCFDQSGTYHQVAGKADTDYCTSPSITEAGAIAVASRTQLHVFHEVKE